jgi:hypothetical protein
MSERQSHHFVGPPFWIGCSITPLLVGFVLWPVRADVPAFFWLVISVVFAGIVGAFVQAVVDLLRAQRAQKLRWLEYLFLTLTVLLATAYGFALFYFPAAEVPLRYGLAGAAPLLIAQLYARSRFFVLRRGPRRV